MKPTPRQREHVKSAVCAVCVLAYFVWAAGWTFTLGFVVLCALVWYFGQQRPLSLAVKRARRKE